MCVECAFCSLKGIFFPVFKLEYKSKQRTSTLTEGPTRDHGVRLTCRSIHFHSSKIPKRLMILLWQFVFDGGGPF